MGEDERGDNHRRQGHIARRGCRQKVGESPPQPGRKRNRQGLWYSASRQRVNVNQVRGKAIGRRAHHTRCASPLVAHQPVHPQHPHPGRAHQHKLDASRRPPKEPAIGRAEIIGQRRIIVEDRITLAQIKIGGPAQVRYSLLPCQDDFQRAVDVMIGVGKGGETGPPEQRPGRKRRQEHHHD